MARFRPMPHLGQRVSGCAVGFRIYLDCANERRRVGCLAEAANMRQRSEIMIAIRRAVAEWETTQAAAARRLEVTQPRLNDLLRGRINNFSLDALAVLAARAGLKLRVQIERAAA